MGNGNSSENSNQIIILGEEQSGKTTFLKKLVDITKNLKEDIQYEPTLGYNFATIKLLNNNYDVWDLGGDYLSQKFWKIYYQTINIKLLVYIINMDNEEKLNESLRTCLTIINEEELKRSFIYIIFNYYSNNINIDNEEKEKNEKEEKVKYYMQLLKEYGIHQYETRIKYSVMNLLTANITDKSFLDIFEKK